MHPKDADGMANRVDPKRSSLIWVCAVWFCLSVPIFRISMVLGLFMIKSHKHLVCYLESKSRLEDEQRAFFFFFFFLGGGGGVV